MTIGTKHISERASSLALHFSPLERQPGLSLRTGGPVSFFRFLQ